MGIPSAPGAPDVVDTGIGEVTIAWSAPLSMSETTIIHGYQIEMREVPDGDWERVHDELLKETTCTSTFFEWKFIFEKMKIVLFFKLLYIVLYKFYFLYNFFLFLHRKIFNFKMDFNFTLHERYDMIAKVEMCRLLVCFNDVL